MQLNPAEISELIKSRIEGLAASANIRNQGTVVSVTDGICRIHGLSDVMQGEMLEFPAGSDGLPTFGLALNLERDSVGAVVLGEYEHISEGDTVKCTGRILEVPVGQMEAAIGKALAEGCYPLVHVVHGSKTGLVLPHLDDIDRLQLRFGGDVAFVVDACQARITTQAIHDYLARGIIVFLTGSKFMGGPPFSGFALLPAGIAAAAAPSTRLP